MTMSCDATLSWHEVRTLHHDHDQLDIMIHDQTTLINTNLSSQSSSDHYASNFPSSESRGNCEETVRKPTNKPLVNHLISDLQQLNHFRSHQLLFMTTMEKMLVMMCLVVVTQTAEKNEFLMRFNNTDAEQDTRQALCCWLIFSFHCRPLNLGTLLQLIIQSASLVEESFLNIQLLVNLNLCELFSPLS